MITKEQIEELRKASNAAFDRYKAALHLWQKDVIQKLLDQAELNTKTKTSGDQRIPTVVFTVKSDIFPGGEISIEINAYSFLQGQAVACSDAVRSMNSHCGGNLTFENAFSPALLDRIEDCAVKAVLHDLGLRLKKNPGAPWLLRLKKMVDEATVGGVHRS